MPVNQCRCNSIQQAVLSEKRSFESEQGTVQPNYLSASAETLELQAQFASEAGYNEVATNLTRAAEMTRMPNDDIPAVYEALRPGVRSTINYCRPTSKSPACMVQKTPVHISVRRPKPIVKPVC